MTAFLDERYFDWLYAQVCSERARNPSKTYRNLLYILYTKEFVWLVPNDDNRAEDGKYLRFEFLEELGIEVDERDSLWLELGCSFLEFLVALSRRLEFETDIDAGVWFHELLENLGLDGLNDRVDISREDVYDVVDRVIWRTYEPNGQGGLFPLEHTSQNQREIEIWYQLSAYILERVAV